MAARTTANEEFEDLEYVEKVPRELICSICFRVLCEPHLVNCCEQQFCKDCLETWLEDNTSCPHCRSSGFSHMLMKQTNRKVGEVKVYCPNKHHGCKAELKISEHQNHLSTANDKGCAYVELDCPNNCSAKVFRGKMLEHQQKLCPKRIVSCAYCKLNGEYLPMVKDHSNKCLLKPVGCPLACGVSVLRQDLQTHRNECPLELVPCSFSGLGCKTKVCRKDLKEHIDSSGLSHHMDLLAKSHMKMQAEHESLQIEHITLQAEHQQLLIEHTTLKDTCNSLREDHVTLLTAYTSLQNSCTALKTEQSALLADHTTLKDTCIAAKDTCASLQKALQGCCGQLRKGDAMHKNVCTTLQDVAHPLRDVAHPLRDVAHPLRDVAHPLRDVAHPLRDVAHPLRDVAHPLRDVAHPLRDVAHPLRDVAHPLRDVAHPLRDVTHPLSPMKENMAPVQLPRKKEVAEAAVENSKPTTTETSRQKLGSAFHLWLIPQDGDKGYHNIIVNGNITLKLEWELDDLFPQSHAENFELTLYLLNSVATQTCSFDVLVSSGYGDSGQLAIVCCGQPQTTLWEGMPTNPSKKLVGYLSLQCNKYDQLKVCLSHHQAKTCKCFCHVINSDSEEEILFLTSDQSGHSETNLL